MRLGPYIVILAFAASPGIGKAQDSAEIEQIANMMVRLCVGGGRTDAVGVTGSGGADLSLRSLDAKGNFKGELKVDKRNAEGLVEGINNAMGQVAADQADKVRACLQPVRERLLDVMLPASKSNQLKTADQAAVVESPPQAPTQEGRSTIIKDTEISLTSGESVYLTQKGIVFSMVKTPYGGRSDLVSVRIGGSRIITILGVGQEKKFDCNIGPCSVTAVHIDSRSRKAIFFIRVPQPPQ